MVFRLQEGAVIYSLAYVVAVFIWAREGSLRSLAKQLFIAGLLGLAVLGVVGVFALTGFDATFERFHLIAFDNDLWRLDPDTDHLIQMFPEEFWRDLSLWVGIASLAELGILTVAAGLYLRFARPATVPNFLASQAQA
jgi:integral membrane protein (TIGR01906 family)